MKTRVMVEVEDIRLNDVRSNLQNHGFREDDRVVKLLAGKSLIFGELSTRKIAKIEQVSGILKVSSGLPDKDGNYGFMANCLGRAYLLWYSTLSFLRIRRH